MARPRYLEPVDQLHDTYHLECPRCGHHSIVTHGESRYVCLNCHWQRDVDGGWGDGPPPFLVLLAIAFIIIVLTAG
ncbi:MAG: hypothetical protein WBD47_22695 [Phormidesmis sp.]